MKMREISRGEGKNLHVNNIQNKGVVTAIVPDDEMPFNEYGEYAEVILNPLGIIGRLSIGQLYEHELNFISDNVLREMNKYDNIEDKERIYFSYIKKVNEEQYDITKKLYDSYSEERKQEFMNNLKETGIMLHQPPYFGNVEFDDYRDLLLRGFDEMPGRIEKYNMKICAQGEDKEDAKSIERPLTMGDLYMIR